MSLAVLCSGQGLQHSGMFALTGTAPAAIHLFAHATRHLGGRDPRDLVATETDDALHANRLGQILCTLQPLAVAAALGGLGAGRLIVAGYSVGEVPAWGLAGLFEPVVTLDLAARRAEAMDAVARPGDGLLFVRGLAHKAIDYLCDINGAAIAIVNPGNAFVLGGAGEALEVIADAAARGGADRAMRISVKVASHTPRLAAAAATFRKDLDAARVADKSRPGMRLLSGVDAAPVINIQAGLDKLAAQISSPVLWANCLAGCVEAGASAFLECGPGRALAEMASAAYPDIPSRSVEDFRTVQGVRDWLSYHIVS